MPRVALLQDFSANDGGGGQPKQPGFRVLRACATWQHKGLGLPPPIAAHLAICHKHTAFRGQSPSLVTVSCVHSFSIQVEGTAMGKT